MTRTTRLLGLASIVAISSCASEPLPIAAPTATTTTVTPPSVEGPTPSALPTVELSIEQLDEFAGLDLPDVARPTLSDAEIEKGLSTADRATFKAVFKALSKVESTKEAQEKALHAWTFCQMEQPSCKKLRSLELGWDRSRDATSKAIDAASKAHADAMESFQKSLEKEPSVTHTLALAFAIARIASFDDRSGEVSLEAGKLDRRKRFGAMLDGKVRRSDPIASRALDRAIEIATETTIMRYYARLGRAYQSWLQGDSPGARKLIEESEPLAPAEHLAQLHLWKAWLHGMGPKANLKEAAAQFRAAIAKAGPNPTGDAARIAETSRYGWVLAEYRAGNFAAALSAAIHVLETKPAPGARAQREGLLLAMGPDFDVEAIAADCVERIGHDALLKTTPVIRARLSGILARRALHRGDTVLALELAQGAVAASPEAGESRVAYDVLIAMARASDRDAEVADLEKRRRALPRISNHGVRSLASLLSDPAHSVAKQEDELLTARREDSKSVSNESSSPDVATRATRSLLRLCLEPVAWRIGETGAKRLTLEASVLTDGKVTVSSRGLEAIPEVDVCLKEMGPRILGHSPSSVRAEVSLVSIDQAGSSNILGLPASAPTGLKPE